MAAKHLLEKLTQAFPDCKNYVFSILNDADVFICVYGVGFGVDERSNNVLALLDIHDGYPSLICVNDRYYKVAQAFTTIRRKALARGDIMLTYVVKITDIMP